MAAVLGALSLVGVGPEAKRHQEDYALKRSITRAERERRKSIKKIARKSRQRNRH